MPMTTPQTDSAKIASTSMASASQRMLACVLCQQRKVRCDRKVPCSNCVKSRAQCVQATLAPRQRRRRFPERDLLERLRRYEDLLHKNNIDFESLHPTTNGKTSPTEDSKDIDSPDDPDTDARTDRSRQKKTNAKSETVDLWDSINQTSTNPEYDDDNTDGVDDGSSPQDDGVRVAVITKTWDQLYLSDDPLFFGSHEANIDLATLHPGQVHIFRLWQIYLENVDVLLKVTHTPTFQTRIINAAGDLRNVSPTLEALMFSIYCAAILSLAEEECRNLFGSVRDELLRRYQLGCQQALLRCGVLRTSDRECLTALYLYLISIRPVVDPRSLSSMLGICIRIAQRMRIHDESTYAKHTALEAEMRRRLWYSLIAFDIRIREMSDSNTAMIAPMWDCKTPLNVNDSDLRPEMKSLSTAHDRPTEAIFAVIRSELLEAVSHSTTHFGSPDDEAQQGSTLKNNGLTSLTKTLENKYLQYCNPENALHFMTIWTTRGNLAKQRLLAHYSQTSFQQQSDTQRDTAVCHALTMLSCDTQLMVSPLSKGYHWYLNFHFPFPAYIHIVQDLRRRPVQAQADKAWETMSDNYAARFAYMRKEDDNPFYNVFYRIVLQAWEAREAMASQQSGAQENLLETPRIVVDIRDQVKEIEMRKAPNSNMEQRSHGGAIGSSAVDESFKNVLPTTGVVSHGMSYGMEGLANADFGPVGYSDLFGEAVMDMDFNQSDWSAMDWGSMHPRSW